MVRMVLARHRVNKKVNAWTSLHSGWDDYDNTRPLSGEASL